MAFLAGGLLLVAGCLRLGYVADFISAPVLAGFKVGTALVIIAGQLGKVLGVPVTGDNFFEKVRSAFSQLDDANGPTVVLAAVTFAVLISCAGSRRGFPGRSSAWRGASRPLCCSTWPPGASAWFRRCPPARPRPEIPDLGLLPNCCRRRSASP